MGTHGCLSLLFLATPLQLEQALDTGVLGQLGGPGGLILSTLQAACRPREEGPSSAFSEHWSVRGCCGLGLEEGPGSRAGSAGGA